MSGIILVRHAEPQEPEGGSGSHWTDTALSARGRRQAARVAARLKEELGDTRCGVYSSDLKRALETAEAIGEALGEGVHPVPALREFKDGLASGGTEEALAMFGTEMTAPMRDLQADPSGETWRAFHDRVASGMDRITRDQEGPIVVVSHYGTTMNIVGWWLGLTLTAEGDTPVSFDASLASVGVLRVNRQGKHTIERLNDTAHLRAEGLVGGIKLDA